VLSFKGDSNRKDQRLVKQEFECVLHCERRCFAKTTTFYCGPDATVVPRGGGGGSSYTGERVLLLFSLFNLNFRGKFMAIHHGQARRSH